MTREPGTGYARSLAFLLSQVGARSAELFADQLRPLGISPRVFGVLSNLEIAGDHTQQQLADALGIHRNNMVALIDEMEAEGWVRRRRSANDRRAFNIGLTPAGRRAIDRVRGPIAYVEQALGGVLEENERATLTVLLERVAAELGLTPGVHPHLRGRR